MNTTTTAYQVGHLYDVPPGDLKIGSNVRTDTRGDAKEFAASIRARGVIEAITACPDPQGGLTVLRGQRRTLVAAKVGTPGGTVPVRVVAAPGEADRITDQMVENLHRASIRERETRDGIEQLALLGVSAAQIVKRTAVARPVVDAALAVAAHEASKARMDEQEMTLEQAAIFAEFEDDPDAVATLTTAWQSRWDRPRLAHVAQRLRDEHDEHAALRAEAERLRAEGLPVLDPRDVPADARRLILDALRDADGNPVPEDQWPTTPGAAVMVTAEWDDGPEPQDEDAEPVEPVRVYVPVWVCTDPDAAGLHHAYGPRLATNTAHHPGVESDDERRAREAGEQTQREAESAERRRVLANNKAWRSAEVVRREWLAGLCSRRVVPKDAEALIARAVLGCQYSLSHALEHGHTLLPTLLGIHTPEGVYQSRAQMCARVLAQATTPKAATMRTLAAVLAAWEDRSGVHTWRNPCPWDAAIMAALIGWGYPASDVEQLLVSRDAPDDHDATDAPGAEPETGPEDCDAA
jgi:ParB family chromosome partitioning protein